MDCNVCPFWIDPGNAFRLVVKVDKYVADGEYGFIEMAEQEHELWFDRSGQQYTIEKFVDDMSTKMIWGPGQTLSIWALDSEGGSKWKIRRDEHFQQLIRNKWHVRVALLTVEVVNKHSDNRDNVMSGVSRVSSSGVTNCGSSAVPNTAEGTADTCSSPPTGQTYDEPFPVDWANLTVEPDPIDEGYPKIIADEELVYEAMGFRAVDERAEEAAREAVPIPQMSAQLQSEIGEAAINVNDFVTEEPIQEWDRDNPDMSVGICFPCMDDFRLAVKQHAIVNEFELRTEHSDKSRFRGSCVSLGCPWRIRARTQHDGSVRVQINDGEHNCASRSRVLSRMASQAWVAERAIPLLKRKPDMGPKAIKDELHEKYKIDIPYQTVFYGRQRAANKLFGKWDDSFDWLYRFKAEVELRSPGSVVEIDTEAIDGEIHFGKFFCCFKAAIDGFREGCRPYISIDSTALNGLWNGQLPAAQALDGHNWMFPLAFGLFASETKDNWTWFMEQLKRAIGPIEKLAVCTDACKGLELSVANVWPGCEQRECFRHLMENMKKNYSGEVFAKNMWPAARAYTTSKFNYFFSKVTAASPDAKEWLDKHHSMLWARSKFSENIKCDYINNNLAECWNAWIKEFKDLPVHCLADAIREKTLTLFAKRRRISTALQPGILPAVIHQLNAASRGLGHLKMTKSHPDQAEVTEIYKDEEVRRHVVYLKDHVCTCREWQVTGKPCPHALAVITSMRQPLMHMYVDKYYSVQKFQAAYNGIIPNITDRHQWPEVDNGFRLLPPMMQRRESGAPKKTRHLGVFERIGKATRQVKCPNCGEFGHRKGSWKCSLTGPKKKRTRTKKTASRPGRKKARTDPPPPPESGRPSKKARADPPPAPDSSTTPSSVSQEVPPPPAETSPPPTRSTPKKTPKKTDPAVTLTPRTRARTRAAVAREAAAKAQRDAEEAAAKAAAAFQAAEEAQREVLDVEPLEVVFAEPATPSRTNRNLGEALQAEVAQGEMNAAPKKMTPRKKQLASKIKKAN